MALHDVDMTGAQRLAPVPASHDAAGVRMAAGTTSVNPVTDATPVNGFIKTADSRALVHDGTDKRISLGVHADQTVGLKISPNGIDVDQATAAQLLFDSNQAAFKIVDSTTTVVTGGLSDTPEIQTAINLVVAEGGGTVLLKNGTYLMSSDIILSDNITLQGETANGVIIDFQNQAFQIKVAADTVYSDGTVLVSAGSTMVTGIGTAWTNALVGQQIQLAGAWYLINAVVSVTELTLDTPFTQTSVSLSVVGGAIFPVTFPAIIGMVVASDYVITTPIGGVSIVNLTVQNSIHSTGAIYFHNGQSLIYNTVNVFDSTIGVYFANTSLVTASGFFSSGCTIGIQVDDSGIWTITNFETFDCGTGLLANRFVNTSVNNFTLSSATGNNATLNDCAQWGFYDATILEAGVYGIQLDGCSDIEIFAMNLQTSGSDGIRLVSDNTRISIHNVTLFHNIGYGINITLSSNSKNTISSSFFEGNTTGTIFDSGTHTIDANNQT